MWRILFGILCIIVGNNGNYISNFNEVNFDESLENFGEELFLELLDEVPSSSARKLDDRINTKECRFREFGLYPLVPYKLATAASCYNYTNPDKIHEKIPQAQANYPYENKSYPILFSVINITGKNELLLYDLSNETIANYIRATFKSEEFFDKYLTCYNASLDCCENYMNETNILQSEEYPCPAVWDGWDCFHMSRAQTTQIKVCPSHIYTSKSLCTAFSEKYCLKDDWDHLTNYNACLFGQYLKRRHEYHIYALTTSICLILPSLIIFIGFRNFRAGKQIHVALHRNLLLALVIRSILTIVSKSAVILDSIKPTGQSNNVMIDNSVGCRILAFLENVSKNAIFTCMLVDAFYLHKLIARSFANDPKLIWLYVATGVMSVTPSLIWAILMGAEGMDNCWMVDEKTWYQWITDGYKFGVLAINTLLLIHILVVLFQKVAKNATKQHTKSTLRATLFMLPLFGIPHLFASQRDIVDISECTDGDTYYYVIYSIDALQGILVAVLFCYLNSEVQKEVKQLFRKIEIRVRERYNLPPRTTNRRRTTAMTNVMNNNSRPSTGGPPSFNDFPRSNNKNVEDWLTESISEAPSKDQTDKY